MTETLNLGPPPDQYLTLNGRLHWAVRSRRAATWRQLAWATNARHQPMPPCFVTCVFPFPNRRRRDPANWSPTVKPIVDGLVDAGLWPDDTPEFVTTTEPELVIGGHDVLVRLTPRP